MKGNAAVKAVLLVWICVLVLDNALPFVLARFYGGYSHRSMALSVLGCRQSPVKRIYNPWCVLSGLVFCAAPCALYAAFPQGLSVAAWVLLAVYGLGCEVISGFCPLNESRAEQDLPARIHGAASALGFVALLPVPLLVALIQLGLNLPVCGAVSLACFLAAFVFFCFFIMGEKERFARTALRHAGLWQRLVLAASYAPLLLQCLLLLSAATKPA